MYRPSCRHRPTHFLAVLELLRRLCIHDHPLPHHLRLTGGEREEGGGQKRNERVKDKGGVEGGREGGEELKKETQDRGGMKGSDRDEKRKTER